MSFGGELSLPHLCNLDAVLEALVCLLVLWTALERGQTRCAVEGALGCRQTVWLVRVSNNRFWVVQKYDIRCTVHLKARQVEADRWRQTENGRSTSTLPIGVNVPVCVTELPAINTASDSSAFRAPGGVTRSLRPRSRTQTALHPPHRWENSFVRKDCVLLR